MAQQYSTSLQEVDARIEEMQAENQGLVNQFTDMIGGVFNTIGQIRSMLEGVLAGAAGAIGAILSDPIGFLGNLISGVKQGLDNFVGNIATHLQGGLVAWLTGTMGGLGIQIPDDLFSLEGIFNLVAQILGLTWDYIRSKAVRMFGDPVVAAMEQGLEMFQVLQSEGAIALWEQVQDQFTDLKEQVIDQIKDMVITQVIQSGVSWMLGLLTPTGAFVKAAQTIYNIVMFFVNRGSQVIELVQAITESIGAIASGALGQAASLVESALAKALPVAIGFLASLIGVSGLARKVQNVVEGIRQRIDDAIEFVLNKAKQMAASLLRRLGIGRGEEGEEEEDKVEIPDGPVGESVTFNTPDEGHRLWIELKGGEPVVMVASTPEQAQTKLDNIASQIQGIQNIPPHLLAKASELLTRGYRLLNVTKEQIDQRLDALRTNENNVDMVNIKAEIDRRANSVPQKLELVHIFQELFEILYNAKHTQEERNPEHAVEWYHSQMQEAMGGDEPGFSSGEDPDRRKHALPGMLAAVVDQKNHNQAYFGMAAENKQLPNQNRIDNAYRPFQSLIEQRSNGQPNPNRPLTNCAEFEAYDKALWERGNSNINSEKLFEGLEVAPTFGRQQEFEQGLEPCNNCQYLYDYEEDGHNHDH